MIALWHRFPTAALGPCFPIGHRYQTKRLPLGPKPCNHEEIPSNSGCPCGPNLLAKTGFTSKAVALGPQLWHGQRQPILKSNLSARTGCQKLAAAIGTSTYQRAATYTCTENRVALVHQLPNEQKHPSTTVASPPQFPTTRSYPGRAAVTGATHL